MTTRDDDLLEEIAWKIRDECGKYIHEGRHIARTIMPLVRRAQAEALREFANDLDRYVGTILNAESAANIARAKANGIEKEGAGA